MKPLLSKEEIAELLAPLDPEPGPNASPAEEQTTDVTTAEKQAPSPDKEIKPLANIPLQIKIEVGCTKVLRQELLQIKKGALITIEKLTDEPLDLYIEDHLIARGELVPVGSKVGIKVIEVTVPTELLRKQE